MALDSYITLECDIDPAEITRAILLEFKDYLDRVFRRLKIRLKPLVAELTTEAIKSSEEYIAMLPGGELYGLIGRPDIENIVEKIIGVILSETKITPSPAKIVGGIVEASLEVLVVNTDYSSLLALDGAHFTSENGFEVNWLDWLLNAGSAKVVFGYQYITENPSSKEGKGFNPAEYSRTETGVMFKNKNEGWGFPGQYSGTPSNNWLTRMALQLETELQVLLEEELMKEIS